MHLAICSLDVAVPNNSYFSNDFRSINLTIWLLRGTWPGQGGSHPLGPPHALQCAQPCPPSAPA